MRVGVTRIDRSLPLPEYQTEGSTAFDFVCREDCRVESRALGFIPSNVIISVPEGFALLVALRSSTPVRTGLIMPHGVGIIDQDYCGPEDEIQIQVFNPTDVPVTVHRGDRIAQGLLICMSRVDLEERPLDSRVSRRGLGSTGG